MTAGSNREDNGATRPRGYRDGSAGLQQRIRATAERALRSGALEPIETETQIVEDGGVRFAVRIARGLEDKRAATRAEPDRANPFLPYDEDLFVGPLGEAHVCLLNKFRVLDDHALIVTREFERQESLLTKGDFRALADVLGQIEGLGFYNAGPAAGASQPHKHLQVVPTPIGAGPDRVPIERLLDLGGLRRQPPGVCQRAALPFRHALLRIDDCMREETAARAAMLVERYHALRQATDCSETRPYNLLVTREWMLLTPRSRDSSHGIEINSLGIAGALFARNPEQLSLITSLGPMQLLCDVTLPKA